jgi:hypothetical protein
MQLTHRHREIWHSDLLYINRTALGITQSGIQWAPKVKAVRVLC